MDPTTSLPHKSRSRLARKLRSILLVGILLSASSARSESLGWNADVLAGELSSVQQLPPLPEGVSSLKFSNLFKSPVGSAGLELTEDVKRLQGKRVRVLGFMVNQEQPSPGTAILAPFAASTHEEEYGLCDDLPPNVVFVDVPKYKSEPVPFSSGPLLLTGKLEIGRRDEPNGRVSFFRLVLDDEPTAPVLHPPSSLQAKN